MSDRPPHESAHESRDDLLVARALWGLDASQESELRALLDGVSVEDAAAEWEHVVAALQEGVAAGCATAPPPGLEAKLLADAEPSFAQGAAGPVPAAADAGGSAVEARGSAPVHVHPAASARPARQPLPWLLAAAALLIAFVGWGPRLAPEPSAAASLEALLAEPPDDLLRLDWIALDDPAAAGATGEIVWSDSAQRDYMRFRGLDANDPSREQYQLWIFDRNQSADYPIDGGVFDVPAADGEIVVPIDAKIAVQEAWQFAVTVEKPGGVVVSDRSRLPLLATTEG